MNKEELAIREVLAYFTPPTTREASMKLREAFETLTDAGALNRLAHRLALAALKARREAAVAEVSALEGNPPPPKPMVH